MLGDRRPSQERGLKFRKKSSQIKPKYFLPLIFLSVLLVYHMWTVFSLLTYTATYRYKISPHLTYVLMWCKHIIHRKFLTLSQNFFSIFDFVKKKKIEKFHRNSYRSSKIHLWEDKYKRHVFSQKTITNAFPYTKMLEIAWEIF